MSGKLFYDAEEDGNGDGDEAEVDDDGECQRALADEVLGFLRAPAECLENGGNAVAEVRAEAGHRDDVEEDDDEVQEACAEAIDDHAVGIGRADVCEVGVHTDGEVEDVEDDEGEDGKSGPDHEAGGFRRLDGVRVSVFGRSCFSVFPGEEDGGPDVKHDDDDETEACDPDECTMAGTMEKLGVVVERLAACVDEEVSGEVTGKEKHHCGTSDGNDELFTDGGLPVGCGGACKGVHERVKSGLAIVGRESRNLNP